MCSEEGLLEGGSICTNLQIHQLGHLSVLWGSEAWWEELSHEV